MESANALLRTDKAEAVNIDFETIYHRHVDMIFRICFMYMKNISETEDCVQDTFLKLIEKQKIFENPEHEKAWLIVTSSNICKNKLKHWWNKNLDLADFTGLYTEDKLKDDTVLVAVMSLPEKYKLPIFLYYYSGYKTDEVAEILHKNPATIRTIIRRAREILKTKLSDSL